MTERASFGRFERTQWKVRPFRFTKEEYAQMRRLIAEHGWTLRGVARQFGVAIERDNNLLQAIRSATCGS